MKVTLVEENKDFKLVTRQDSTVGDIINDVIFSKEAEGVFDYKDFPLAYQLRGYDNDEIRLHQLIEPLNREAKLETLKIKEYSFF